MTTRRKLPTLAQILHRPTLITGVGFFAGVFATAILHAFTGEMLNTTEKVIWGIVSFLALMVSLAIILIGRVGQEALNNQKKILDELEEKFGLKAEFIRDEEDTGRSYRRTQEYIENSKTNMLFVDSWVECTHYDESQRRKDYYRAIEDRIKRKLDDRRRSGAETSGIFYRRITQLPPGKQPSAILKDKVYSEHLKKCAKLQEGRREIIRVDRAKPFTHINFGIIDDRYFVQSILTTEGGLRRHGAIIFTDPEGELIERYKSIILALELDKIDESELVITESQLQTNQ